MKKALILSDGKPGHYNQSIALCRHLTLSYELIETSYPTGAAKALSYLFDRLNIYTDILFKFAPRKGLTDPANHSFDLIISTGSSTYYPSKWLAQQLKLPNIAILMPKSYRTDFSHIFCPAYDHPPQQPNITPLPLNLCAADANFFTQNADEFLQKYPHTKQPAVGIIIGGPSKVSMIDPSSFRSQLQQVFEQTTGYTRWVTTSRRTPPEIEAIVKSFPFDVQVMASTENYNPIPAFIHLCDRLFVTSDSASMISECASFGTAKVEILMNQQLRTPNKFEAFIQGLEDKKALHRFDGTLGNADQKINLSPLLNQALSELLSTDPRHDND